MICMKPIEKPADRTWLNVEAYWMPRPYEESTMSLCSRPSLPSDLESAPNQRRINSASGRWITSGYKITMSNLDPVNLPLPSRESLELRWVLDRIARLAGVEDKYGCADGAKNDNST